MADERFRILVHDPSGREFYMTDKNRNLIVWTGSREEAEHEADERTRVHGPQGFTYTVESADPPLVVEARAALRDGEQRYRSDDRDLPGHDNDLLVFSGGNGDWYVSVVKHGEKIGPCVRITTSGSPRGQEGVCVAVARLHRAMAGEGDG